MSGLRQWIRRVVPLTTRQAIAQVSRQWRDSRRGLRLAPRYRPLDPLQHVPQLEIRQPIRGGFLLENKHANLVLGARAVNTSVIGPGQTWSFWHHVGRPSASQGFLKGRNLVGGELTPQVGGGLCQLSGLLYHLGLSSGLVIAERHPHSFDIYQEHERVTPLGADATVVWGFKDLRLRNPLAVEVVLECFVEGYELVGRVHAQGMLPKCQVEFLRQPLGPTKERVTTRVNRTSLGATIYERKL